MIGVAGPEPSRWKQGRPVVAMPGELRKPPSVTTPATPRIFIRSAIMSPMHRDPRVVAGGHHQHGVARTFLDSAPVQAVVSLVQRHAVEILARRDEAQGESRPDQRRLRRGQRLQAQQKGVAQPTLQQAVADVGRTAARELVACHVRQRCDTLICRCRPGPEPGSRQGFPACRAQRPAPAWSRESGR